MHDFNYFQRAVDLDRRLERVIQEDVTAKAAAAKAAEENAPLGLQAFIERSTIAEEIAAVLPKTAGDLDINVIKAKEKIASIAEEHAGRFEAFASLTAPVVAEMNKEAAERATIDNRLAELRGSVTTERS